ncbi:MAG: recombinase family protein [Lachnospiraceae bacterium]|nr:recombinase family protein [Lachnospiraceae bacterium]
MKRVRMLLRVSSDQQLEATGDLSIQRQILQDFISKQDDWVLDTKEYFEGSKSAYKNTAEERDVLQEILEDARNKEFDILVPYKDDRVGRLMLNTSLYVVNLKRYNVDVYSVKDGCISPKSDDDIEGMMMLMFRYANAQKSSKDTGMRVKDTAQKLVQGGKFMGGSAPFGYTLEFSGQISKHGRALKHLVIVPEQAELVKHIYSLSLNKEYGSAKIAKELNLNEKHKTLAPNGVWKGGTITSILTNPIYAGHTAYKRRERINGQYHRLDSKDWITSYEANEEITIIDSDTWNKVQDKRKQRNDKYIKKLENKDVTVIRRNDGMLPLVDVLHCGYCGSKMVNGSKYNYWTIKGTGERRASKIPIYKCQNAWQGVPHDKTKMHRADLLEPIVFEALSQYIGKLQENENVFEQIEQNHNSEKKQLEKLVKKEKQELAKIQKKIDVMESNIPNAMLGEYPLSLEELVSIIKKHKEQLEAQQEVVKQKELEFKNSSVSADDWKTLREQIPTWQEVFLNADVATKRVLVNKLIERIDVKKDEVVIRFKINLNDFFQQPRMSGEFEVPESRL